MMACKHHTGSRQTCSFGALLTKQMDMTDDYWPDQYIKNQSMFYLIAVDAICIKTRRVFDPTSTSWAWCSGNIRFRHFVAYVAPSSEFELTRLYHGWSTE